MPKIQKVLIVGGGVGGLTLGAALGAHGIECEILEIKKQHSVLGVGIIQPGNVLRALKGMGLLQACLDAGFPTLERRYHDTDGRVLVSQPAAKIAGDDAPAISSLPRSALHRILLEAAIRAGATVSMGTTLTSFSDVGIGVEASLSDGRQMKFDLLVAADGIRSLLRNQLFPNAPETRYSGYGCWRVTLPRPPDMNYSGIYQGANGTKAGLIALTQETMYLYLVTTEPGNPWMAPEQQYVLLRERLRGYGGIIGDIREGLNAKSDVYYAALEEVVQPAPWYRGNALLIGDAAHASLPHMAQGAAMAIEDALVLAELAALDLSMPERLARFMTRRYERCMYVQNTSHAMADSELDYTPEKVLQHQAYLTENFPAMWKKNELRMAEAI
jgi:2-polyprenyl-6-methoxyphenol hydroxylase-like FAD-dependent oxidoreductase